MGDNFFDQLKAVWPLVMQAPWTFVAFGTSVLALGFMAGRFAFSERIANLKSRIETRDERIAAYEAAETARRLEMDKPKPPSVPEPKPATVRLTKEQAAAIPSAPIAKFRVTREPESLKDILTSRKWVFYFSPSGNNGRKNMTFLPDGTIGEGRNENEYRWVFEGDLLVIYRRNGDVQNSFRHNHDSGRFEYLPDQRAQGFKDQFIEPLDETRKSIIGR